MVVVAVEHSQHTSIFNVVSPGSKFRVVYVVINYYFYAKSRAIVYYNTTTIEKETHLAVTKNHQIIDVVNPPLRRTTGGSIVIVVGAAFVKEFFLSLCPGGIYMFTVPSTNMLSTHYRNQ